MIKLTLLILGISLVNVSLAEPFISVERAEYVVSGTTVDQLRNSLDQSGPIDAASNKRFHASTKWQVKWAYDFRERAKLCNVDRVTVSIEIKFTMPRWKEYETGQNYLREKWNKYYAALQVHENGHKDFGMSAAQEIEKAILNLNNLPCKDVATTVDKTANEILNHYKTKETEYDRTTRHGQMQDVYF